ncbi:hypothetical protein [Actinomadura sp. B10D3]|uniref:hypothetical protein n=1 Tax=Actinomadura sp. B10D3 TaxID=3153557 RepID=UPI00325DA0F0
MSYRARRWEYRGRAGERPRYVLSRLLIGILALGFLLIFVTGFREFVKSVDSRYEWAGNLAFATGISYVIVTLVSSGLEAGAVIQADQTIAGRAELSARTAGRGGRQMAAAGESLRRPSGPAADRTQKPSAVRFSEGGFVGGGG